MSLKVCDMVLIPEGVHLWAGEELNFKLVRNNKPNYGVILENKILIKYLHGDHFTVAIGDNRYYVKEEDLFPCL